MTQNGPDGATAPRAAVVGAAGPVDAEPAGGPSRGVIDLLGLLAYALLVAFFRLAEDAALAESLADKASLAERNQRDVPGALTALGNRRALRCL